MEHDRLAQVKLKGRSNKYEGRHCDLLCRWTFRGSGNKKLFIALRENISLCARGIKRRDPWARAGVDNWIIPVLFFQRGPLMFFCQRKSPHSYFPLLALWMTAFLSRSSHLLSIPALHFYSVHVMNINCLTSGLWLYWSVLGWRYDIFPDMAL